MRCSLAMNCSLSTRVFDRVHGQEYAHVEKEKSLREIRTNGHRIKHIHNADIQMSGPMGGERREKREKKKRERGWIDG